MALNDWLYRDGRPNRLARILDRCTAVIYGSGVARNYLVRLEVSGRNSGRVVSLPLVMTVVDDERYLVSMLGNQANWVRNVEAARGRVTLRHGRREAAWLQEVALPDRAPVLQAYLRRAPNARTHFPVLQDAPLAEFHRIAERFPVFRVTSAKPVHSRSHDDAGV